MRSNPERFSRKSSLPCWSTTPKLQMELVGLDERRRKMLLGGALIPGLTMGHAVGGGTGLLALHGILSDPMLQSRLAIGIDMARKANPARWGGPQTATAV